MGFFAQVAFAQTAGLNLGSSDTNIAFDHNPSRLTTLPIITTILNKYVVWVSVSGTDTDFNLAEWIDFNNNSAFQDVKGALQAANFSSVEVTMNTSLMMTQYR